MFEWCRRLLGRQKKVETVNHDYLTRLDCQELNALHHDVGNAVVGIERERKTAAIARKEAAELIVLAVVCLRRASGADERMKEHLNRIDTALRGGPAK